MSKYLPQLTHGDRAYRREKIVRAYLAGYRVSAIAETYGVSPDWVGQIARKQGIARRRGPWRRA